jgi:hypothetical protein
VVHQQFWVSVNLGTCNDNRHQPSAAWWLCLQEGRTLTGLTGSVTSVAINHNTEVLASAR